MRSVSDEVAEPCRGDFDAELVSVADEDVQVVEASDDRELVILAPAPAEADSPSDVPVDG